jgi:hypothetical protein
MSIRTAEAAVDKSALGRVDTLLDKESSGRWVRKIKHVRRFAPCGRRPFLKFSMFVPSLSW